VSEYGIHWRELDEDLSFEGFFREKKSNLLYDLFIAHPELNASAVARRLGLSQSLFAQTDFVTSLTDELLQRHSVQDEL
jgi:hypothetical protein